MARASRKVPDPREPRLLRAAINGRTHWAGGQLHLTAGQGRCAVSGGAQVMRYFLVYRPELVQLAAVTRGRRRGA